MLRVRQVLELSSYRVAINKDTYTALETSKFPYSVYKSKAFSEFGLFGEFMVQYFLYKAYPDQVVLHHVDAQIASIFFLEVREAVRAIKEYLGMTEVEVGWPLINKIKRDSLKAFRITPDEKIYFNHEVAFGMVVGHPDVVIIGGSYGNDVRVYDIKTISKPITSAAECESQAEMYRSILKLNGYNVTHYGLYYVLHSKLIEPPVSEGTDYFTHVVGGLI